MFHLLELDGAEDEVSGRNFVAERFAHLRDAEGHFGARRALYVQKVYKLALRRFGAEINFVLAFVRYPARSFEHKVEGAYRRPIVLAAVGAGDLVLGDVRLHLFVGHRIGIDFALGMRLNEVIRAETRLAFLTVHFGIGERGGVPARLPHARIHQDRRVHAVRVLTLLHEALPPCALYIVFDLHADGAVIPCVAHAAVNFAPGEDDAPRLAKVYDLVHRDRSFVRHKKTPRKYLLKSNNTILHFWRKKSTLFAPRRNIRQKNAVRRYMRKSLMRKGVPVMVMKMVRKYCRNLNQLPSGKSESKR